MSDTDNIDNIYHADSRSIIISEDITESLAKRVMYALLDMSDDSETPINVFVNSQGGDVFSGFAIFDMLRKSSSTINTVATGATMSMAAMILQAGDNRIAYPNAILMFHHGTDNVGEVSSKSLRNWARCGTEQRRMCNEILSETAGNTPAYWEKKLDVDQIFTAQEALKHNLIDRIAE